MAYFGVTPSNVFGQGSKDSFNGDGSTTAFTLSRSVLLATDIEVFVGNVRQEPTTSYTTNGTTLNFVGYTVAASDDIYVIFSGKALQTIVPPDGSVSTAKIASSAVTNAKIATGISSSKLTGALPAIDGSAVTGVSSIGVGQTWTDVTSSSNIVRVKPRKINTAPRRIK